MLLFTGYIDREREKTEKVNAIMEFALITNLTHYVFKIIIVIFFECILKKAI